MPHQIRSNVLAMKPYVPGKPIEEVKRELGLDRVVKLASNENPLGPSPLAVKAVQNAAADMHLYPDASGHQLRAALAAKFEVKHENVLIGNGSDELIHLLGLVLLQPGDEMVLADPTFVRYAAAAELAGVKIVRVPLDSEYRHDLPAMAKACTDKTKMVFVANPHNPTGTVVDAHAVETLLAHMPPNATLVMDEAYFEFGRELPDFPDSISYMLGGQNVVVLRTFSKAYGLAGIRIGYGFASPDLVDGINRAREPFHVNSLAQAAAVAALQDDEHLKRTIKMNKEGLEQIANGVEAMGFSAVPSCANFICIDVKGPGIPIFEGLLHKGVIVRPGEPLGLPHHIRVTVGTAEEIDIFLKALKEVVG